MLFCRQTGINFLPEEDVTLGKAMVAMISRGLWERRYGADPAAIGKTISANLKTYTIVACWTQEI
jgi:putative ABC transport system permease protein